MEHESSFAILARYQQAHPVDLDGLARDLGLSVYNVSMAAEIAGKIVRDSKMGGSSGFAIYINNLDHPNRQRFTFAHEIAHYILHRDLIETGIVDDSMYRSNLSSPHEIQANRLAADILMPVDLVKQTKVHIPQVDGLAHAFRVSPAAMQIRLNGMK